MDGSDDENEEKLDETWSYTGPLDLTIEFAEALKFNEKDPNPVHSITLKEPQVEQYSAYTDVMNKTKNEFEAGAKLIAMNANINVKLVGKMTGRDFKKAQDFFTGFTTPPPKGG